MSRTTPTQPSAPHPATGPYGPPPLRGVSFLSDCPIGRIARIWFDDQPVLVVDHQPGQDLVLVYRRGVGLHRMQANLPIHPQPQLPGMVEPLRDRRDHYVAGYMHHVCGHQPIGPWAFRDPRGHQDWSVGYRAAAHDLDAPGPIRERVWNQHTHHQALASYAAWRLDQLTARQ